MTTSPKSDQGQPISSEPEGWVWVALSDVTHEVRSVNPILDPKKTFRYVDISAIDNSRGLVEGSKVKRFKGIDAPSRARRPVAGGDVIYSNVRTYLRNIALIDDDVADICSTGFTVLRPTDAVDSRFLFRYLTTDQYLQDIAPHETGTHYPATSDRAVLSQEIALPPHAEQRRIVEKIEALLARISKTRDQLQNSVMHMQKIRRAILRAAVNGDLTKKWRSDHQASEWCTLSARDACAMVQSGGTPKTGFVDSGVPFLKVYNLVNQQINFGYRSQFVPIEVHQKALRKSIALPHDVVMNIVGPPMGKVAVLTTQFPEWNINQALVLFRPSDRVTSGWLYILLRDGRNVQEVMNDTKGIVGQVNISLSQCRDFEFPIPSIAEQCEIVRRVDSLLALTNAIEKRVNTALARANRLPQSLLAKAFAGELVPTEAELARREGRDYEPASVLLDRIRQEQSATTKPARSSPQKRPRK